MQNTGPEAQTSTTEGAPSITLGLIFERLHPRLKGHIREVKFDPKAKHDWEAIRVFSCQVRITLATLDPIKLRRCADAALIIRECVTTAACIRHTDDPATGLFDVLHTEALEKGRYNG